MSVRVITGDCRQIMATLPDESVHCVVTSPPYFGLRDYGVAAQIGLEDTPSAFVAEMVAVFREVRRVLRKDGTLWLNLGDSYSNGGRTTRAPDALNAGRGMGVRPKDGMRPKDRLMIPARVALALQADGWWLRDEIVWHKPNPMPSSVSDRTTPAHEMMYTLTRSTRYFYDHEAIKEDAVSDHASGNGFKRGARKSYQNADGTVRGSDEEWAGVGGKRNKRSVWTVPVLAFAGAHFATFPPDLIEDAIKAGCPAGGIVLDPFGGAGTTGLVADRLGRDAILIELNPDYAAMARDRLSRDGGMFMQVAAE